MQKKFQEDFAQYGRDQSFKNNILNEAENEQEEESKPSTREKSEKQTIESYKRRKMLPTVKRNTMKKWIARKNK